VNAEAGDLEIDQIVGVVDHALRIRLGVADPDLGVMGCRDLSRFFTH